MAETGQEAATPNHEAAPAESIAPDEQFIQGELAIASLITRWTRPPDGASATGDGIASPLGQIAWAMYEWARNPYYLLVNIYIFSTYFTSAVVGDPVRGQTIWGYVISGAAFVVVLLAPFLGAIADAGGRRKPWIAVYTVIMVAAMLALWMVKPNASQLGILVACLLVGVANVSYDFSAVFHNSMLPAIAPHHRVGSLSGLGLALGNVAGILLLLFMLIAFALPGKVHWSFIPAHPLFGIDQALHEPERLSGPMSGIWLALFSLPLFFFTPDRPSMNLSLIAAVRKGVGAVMQTVLSLSQYRNVAHYLGARAIFNDGMTGVLTFSGIYAAGTFHWHALQMVMYGLELSVFAVFGGFLGGWLDDHLGSKRALIVSVGGTIVFSLASLTMGPDRILWLIPYDVHAAPVWDLPFFNTWPELIFMAILNGGAICITAAYANSRTMLARLAPPDRMSEFFGIYALSGQATTFMAPLAVSLLTVATHSQRGGMLAISAFLTVGLTWLILAVKEGRAPAV